MNVFLLDKRIEKNQQKLMVLQKKNADTFPYMGVSKNRDTPKWMVFNGKPF